LTTHAKLRPVSRPNARSARRRLYAGCPRRSKANDGGAKAYIHSLGEALHYEFKPRGVYVTVVPPPLTNTAVLAKLGFDPRTMPMKPMSVEQCASEGLQCLLPNGPRSRWIPHVVAGADRVG
jgi:uncharacterized protein